MTARVTAAELPLFAQGREQIGILRIQELPRDSRKGLQPPGILDRTGDSQLEPTVEPVQLLEGREYLYHFDLSTEYTSLSTDLPEIFEADTSKGDRGRIKTGLYTGTLRGVVEVDQSPACELALEVRSRKLDYLSQYRWMLRDIVEESSEIIMSAFGPSRVNFAPDPRVDAATLYQRVAFVSALITGERFEAAISQILARPYHHWTGEDEFRRLGQGAPASSEVARQLVRPGPRTRTPKHLLPPIPTALPRRIRVTRHEAAVDNPPNRLVKFALEHWLDVVRQLRLALSRKSPGAAVERGLRQTASIEDHLEGILAEELFREVGRLDRFPDSSSVLQKREGYRDVLNAYVLFEVAASLSWRGGDDVYGAGQRDVATLYEYWVYLQLGRIVSSLCGTPFEFDELVHVSRDRVSVELQKGTTRVLSGTARRLGRELKLGLWYNRGFPAGEAGSWTTGMRPDYSLRISPAHALNDGSRDVWLHFDAKYRIESLGDVFDTPSDSETKEGLPEFTASATATRSDLLKMHAYRDAIRRSAGAYVLYPGTERRDFREYHELLPGLGAFALRPSESGHIEGSATIRQFLDDVLQHVATQSSQHERARYWASESYRPSRQARAVSAVPFLEKPPADTPTLLGYIKSRDHLAWIEKHGLYNLRADNRTGSVGVAGRELGVSLAVLWSSIEATAKLWRITGAPRLMDRNALMQLDYPNPGGGLYFCLPIEPVPEAPRLSFEGLERVRARIAGDGPYGAPLVASWFDLLDAVEGD